MPQARACALRGNDSLYRSPARLRTVACQLPDFNLRRYRFYSLFDDGAAVIGSAAGCRHYDGASADELIKTGRWDPYTGPARSGTEVDDRQVAGCDEAVDGPSVDVQGGGDGGYG